jgi:hypothetical protein
MGVPSPLEIRAGRAQTGFPKACKFATDGVITASYLVVTTIVEVYRGGEIIET